MTTISTIVIQTSKQSYKSSTLELQIELHAGFKLIDSSPSQYPSDMTCFCFVVKNYIFFKKPYCVFDSERASPSSFRCLHSADESSLHFHLHFSCPSIFYFKKVCNGLVPPSPPNPWKGFWIKMCGGRQRMMKQKKKEEAQKKKENRRRKKWWRRI